uniref:GMP synthase, N-terminal domain (GuaA) n=1 Tax=uncultured marine group II/III euryarchaeote SAT1000_17_E06 TaxID=1456561 RepID=A0A075IBV1_9EURY|nr:GMP synthase, N-terminal domain (guaA) [uncultured marine group II/III euryarchaeote SAT1000_17_E06]
MAVAVVDNGGQWTHREWRVLNYLGCAAEIMPNTTPPVELERFRALVLSGGAPRIESEADALGLTAEYLDAVRWPILGICVGHQYMAAHFGGAAGPARVPEFGAALISVAERGWLMAGLPDEFTAWESHNDEVTRLPDEFDILASSDDCAVQAMQHRKLPYAGVQYHPEVEHSEYGAELFQNFLNKALEWNE